MNGLLFLNGTPPGERLLLEIVKSQNCKNQLVACTDGAYNYLCKYLTPKLLIGDFDSIDLKLLKKLDASVEIIKFAADKNFTDGFLAIKELAKRGVTKLDIYGATGGRCDHEQSNYLILALCRELNIAAKIIDEQFDIYLVGEKFNSKAKNGEIVSIVPYSDSAHIIYTKGLKYKIDNLTMNKSIGLSQDNYIMGVSNLAMGEEIELSVGSGLALVFLQRL